jgi:hypothetical protein
MIAPSVAAVLVALAALADPPKQSWDAAMKPDVDAQFMPRSALVEVDGKSRGRGTVTFEVGDPKRTYRIRVSAEGFEPEEAVVEAGRIANRQFFLALRPAGFGRKVDPADAVSMALAASALLKAGRADDAAEYAEQSLRTGSTPLANRVLGDVWRSRGDPDKATRYYAMYLSLADDPPDGPEIKAWLSQPRPGDITIPAR